MHFMKTVSVLKNEAERCQGVVFALVLGIRMTMMMMITVSSVYLLSGIRVMMMITVSGVSTLLHQSDDNDGEHCLQFILVVGYQSEPS